MPFLPAGAAQFAAAVREQPSLITGLLSQRDLARAAPDYDPEAPIFYGLRGGTQTLTDALAAALPARMVEPLVGGPTDGWRVDMDAWQRDRALYYAAMGWDPESGLPGRARLHELDLDWVVDELERHGALAG